MVEAQQKAIVELIARSKKGELNVDDLRKEPELLSGTGVKIDDLEKGAGKYGKFEDEEVDTSRDVDAADDGHKANQ